MDIRSIRRESERIDLVGSNQVIVAESVRHGLVIKTRRNRCQEVIRMTRSVSRGNSNKAHQKAPEQRVICILLIVDFPEKLLVILNALGTVDDAAAWIGRLRQSFGDVESRWTERGRIDSIVGVEAAL